MLELFLQVLCWSIGLCFLLWGALWVLHRRVWHTGTPITKVLPPTPQRPCQVSFTQISGDVGANLVVKEMFDDYAYFKNGVQLPSRGSNNRPPLILDVGANIGLFALAVGTHPGMTEGFDIISFEIVPALRELVEKNTAGLNNGSAQRVRVVDCGLGSSRCDIDVTFEPTFTAGSSAHKDSITSVLSSEHGAIDFIAAWLHDVGVVGTIPMWLAKALCRLLRIPLLGVVAAAVIGVLGGVFLVVNKFAMPVHGQTVKGHIERLDDVLASLGEGDATRPIAMLKIDVEGAEADVLDGIGDATWARVRQAVVEVHDIKGRVGRIKEMLESRGFIVEIGVEELAMHEIFHMSTIFAHRAP